MPAMHQNTVKDVRGTDVCAKELQVTRAALLRYRGAMAGVVRSVGVNGPTVEDVVHDAFEMACRKAEADRPDSRDEARFGGWLCTLARYAALTARNDTIRSREISSPSEELEDVPELNAAYISHFDDKVAASVVFANLNADDRSLLHQHFYEDKTVQELAAERGIPWTTMRSRLDGVIHRARTIMDDKSSRRRAVGASTMAWLALSFGEVYARLYESWVRSKRIISATAMGFVTGGAVVAALLGSSSDEANFDERLALASYAGAVGTSSSGAFTASTTKVVAHSAAGVPAGFKSCFALPVVLPPTTSDGTWGGTKPSSTSNSALAIHVEDRSRAMVPWGVSAVVRDDKPKRK